MEVIARGSNVVFLLLGLGRGIWAFHGRCEFWFGLDLEDICWSWEFFIS